MKGLEGDFDTMAFDWESMCSRIQSSLSLQQTWIWSSPADHVRKGGEKE